MEDYSRIKIMQLTKNSNKKKNQLLVYFCISHLTSSEVGAPLLLDGYRILSQYPLHHFVGIQS